MDILEKLNFLDKRDSIIIHNITKAKEAYVGFDKDYFIEATQMDYMELIDMNDLVKDIIDLGRKLYECNKNSIEKIKDEYDKPSRCCVTSYAQDLGVQNASMQHQVFKYDFLIFRRDTTITVDTANIIKEWCDKDKPMTFTNHNNSTQNKVDIHSLVDIAIFMYLLFSAINNENIKRIDDYSKRQKLIKYDNGIRYSNIVDNYIDEEHFYARIISYLNFYEDSLIDNSRPILKETTKLYFKEIKDENGKTKGYKPELKRCFENIYSFYLFIIKMGTYAGSSNCKIVNMCPCGEVLISKAELCDNCIRMFDSWRKKSK